MPWTQPEDVKSPKDRLGEFTVLHRGEAGEASLSRGIWDGVEGELLLRWNGTDENPNGHPSSHGHPTWQVLPQNIVELIQNLP